jgi:hypothetical protein
VRLLFVQRRLFLGAVANMHIQTLSLTYRGPLLGDGAQCHDRAGSPAGAERCGLNGYGERIAQRNKGAEGLRIVRFILLYIF